MPGRIVGNYATYLRTLPKFKDLVESRPDILSNIIKYWTEYQAETGQILKVPEASDKLIRDDHGIPSCQIIGVTHEVEKLHTSTHVNGEVKGREGS